MAIRKTVRRGDSLWSLACRYLGSGSRYPQILNFHNQEAARYGLRPIDQPDLIFVGETILIPPRPKFPKPGSGTRAEGGKPPIPLNLKVTYVIGRDTPPIIYSAFYGDYTLKTEISGAIDIEIASHDRYHHSLELFMSKNPLQARQKLHDAYDPAIVALTTKPEMVFESGRVKIEAPVAAHANLGPYIVEVQALTPLQMLGTLKPPAINGTLEMGRRKFKYSADIEFRTEVTWHQKPKGGPETVKATEPTSELNQNVADYQTKSTKWDRVVDEKGVIVAVVLVAVTAAGSILYRIATRGGLQPAPIMTPFTHTIDRHNLRA